MNNKFTTGHELKDLRRENTKLKAINRALMNHVEQGLDGKDNAYRLFQAAVVLDREVQERTTALEEARQAVEVTSRQRDDAIILSHATQNRLQDAINSISEGFAIFDVDDRLVVFNRRFLEFWPNLDQPIEAGLTFDDLLERALVYGLLPPAGKATTAQWQSERLHRRCAARYGEANRWIYGLPDGRWVQVNEHRSIEDGIASIYTDITGLRDAERRQHEQAMAEQSAHLRATLNSMSIGVAVFDRHHRLSMANRPYGDLLHLPAPLTVTGSPFEAFLRFNDLRGISELGPGSAISHDGDTARIEVTVDGRWFLIKRDPMPDSGFVLSFSEITELRLAEAALYDSEQRLQIFANSMPNMMSYIDGRERYLFVNRAYRTTFLPQSGKIIGKRMRAVLEAGEYALRRDHINAVLAGRTAVFELPLPTAEGEQRFAIATYVPHRDITGAVVGFFTLIQDITERRRAERLLERANEELEQRVEERTASLQTLNSSLLIEVEKRRRIALELRKATLEAERANITKTQFLTDASHDLMQPLSTARLFIAALQDRPKSDDLNQILAKIDHALSNVEDILNILLDISKIDAGRVKVETAPVSLRPLMLALRDEMLPLAEHHALDLRVATSDLTVCSDARLLKRLLQNFLTNACRYTPQGRILFGARRRGRRVELQVIDTGIGIPKDKIDDIFEEFHRLNPAAAGDKGFGLGLSIVKRIGKLLDHPVQVRSEVGRGSVFSVTLPVMDEKALPHVPAKPALSPSSVEGIRVLVVDNDRNILDGMTGLLNSWRCLVFAASDLEGAINVLSAQGERPDILLADFHLDHDRVGTDVISDIRRRFGFTIPAALITADRNEDVQAQARQMPSVSLLVKPVKPARLRALLASVRQ